MDVPLVSKSGVGPVPPAGGAADGAGKQRGEPAVDSTVIVPKVTGSAGGAIALEVKSQEQDCPLCGADDPELALVAADTAFEFPGQFRVVTCRRCGMRYTNPVIAPADIGQFYPANYSAHAADRAMRQRSGRRSRDPWDNLPLAGERRLLDVGCGSGALLARRRQDGWNVTGVEPSETAANAARALGLTVHTGLLAEVDLKGQQFEAVTMLGVIGCVFRPLETLRCIRRLLTPDGILIVSEHNAASAAASVFGTDWLGWDLPRHYNHFTPQTMQRMLAAAGFDRITLRGKRRTSRWRHGARRMAVRTGELRWRMMAKSRRLCSAAAMAMSRGARSDEVVAIARVPPG